MNFHRFENSAAGYDIFCEILIRIGSVDWAIGLKINRMIGQFDVVNLLEVLDNLLIEDI